MTLPEVLLSEERKKAVVQDCVALVDEEVAKKGGLMGMAVKTGYGVVRGLDNRQMVPKLVSDLLPEFASAFEPFHADFRAKSSPKTFADYSRGREGELAEALLGITDIKAKHAKNGVLKKVYAQLRPTARRHIEDAVPGVARVIDRHHPKA